LVGVQQFQSCDFHCYKPFGSRMSYPRGFKLPGPHTHILAINPTIHLSKSTFSCVQKQLSSLPSCHSRPFLSVSEEANITVLFGRVNRSFVFIFSLFRMTVNLSPQSLLKAASPSTTIITDYSRQSNPPQKHLREGPIS